MAPAHKEQLPEMAKLDLATDEISEATLNSPRIHGRAHLPMDWRTKSRTGQCVARQRQGKEAIGAD
jgi:hypothetical protein